MQVQNQNMPELQLIRPPSPPSEELLQQHNRVNYLQSLLNSPFTPGEFTYIENSSSRSLIKNGYHAVRLTETANFVKQDIESFQWSSDPNIWVISAKMEEIEEPPGHTGFTFGWTMREVQKIYRLGEEEYRRNWILAQIKKVSHY
jgi:hypothetical protein